jgi:uncharacterized YigZ family protein
LAAEDTYLTIDSRAEGIFRDRGSRFLAFAFPVQSRDEIGTILADLKKAYHDARHHCYAYRLGADKKEYRVNDGGEPSNSAGRPILGQITSRDLSNILIVVVRYFGGTKLGVGGLIHAYRSAASDALENARIVKAVESDPVEIRYPYALTGAIMKIVDEERLKIREQDFTETCRLTVLVPKSRSARLLERVNKLAGASAVPAGS